MIGVSGDFKGAFVLAVTVADLDGGDFESLHHCVRIASILSLALFNLLGKFQGDCSQVVD